MNPRRRHSISVTIPSCIWKVIDDISKNVAITESRYFLESFCYALRNYSWAWAREFVIGTIMCGVSHTSIFPGSNFFSTLWWWCSGAKLIFTITHGIFKWYTTTLSHISITIATRGCYFKAFLSIWQNYLCELSSLSTSCSQISAIQTLRAR